MTMYDLLACPLLRQTVTDSLHNSPSMEAEPSQQHSERYRTLWRAAFWGVVAALGLLQAWTDRTVMNPDGISYLEIGRTGISGWHAFVNAYWSPLYPFFLSLVLRWFRPSPFWEFPAAHLLNLAIYLAGYACLEFLVREFLLLRGIATANGARKYFLSGEELRISAAVLYLWASRYWLGTALVSPDFLVAAIFCLSTAMLVRIRRGEHGWLTFALLGAILGLGYLAKAPMFPLGFVFVFAAYWLVRGAANAFTRSVVALLLFLAISLPFVAALSQDKHRLTFGDAATISYAEYVDHMPLFVHWHGEIPHTGTPVHPTRRVLADPPLFEFATPIPGSYPPWYDPSYWYEGLHAHFSLRGEFLAIFRAANEYLKMFSRSGALWCILVVAIWMTSRGGGFDHSGPPWWPVLLPALAALAMYSLVHAETRFVTGAGMVLVLWPLSRAQIAATLPRRRRTWAMPVVFLAPAIAIAWSTIFDLQRLAHPEPFVAWEAAKALHAMGVPAGAKVGYIGPGAEAHWAHLAGVQIIAEIPDPSWSRFAALDDEAKQAVLQKFAQIGAVAVVTKHGEIASDDPDWQPLPNTDLFAVLLAHAEPAGSRGANQSQR